MAAFSLAGCASTRYLEPPKKARPPLKTYTQDQRNRAADELSKLSEDDILVQMMGDYGNLRTAIRQ